VLTFEALTIAFFAALGMAASFTRAGSLRRSRGVLFSAAAIVCVLATMQTVAAPVRVWFGHAYLVAAYWIPALIVPAAARAFTAGVGGTQGSALLVCGAFEAWLVRSEERCRRYAIPLPAWAGHALELSYLLCYILVPVAFTVPWAYGTLAETDRFWTAVLISGFACYGTLPWLVNRPPRVRLTNTAIEESPLRRANVRLLSHISHGLNTFPSGHVAVSVAAALEVMSISRPAGLAMMAVAAGIAGGALAGRYHYAVDVASGIVVGIVASSLV
jgi:hypothetical protein